jgi:hypothetical protein
LDIEPDIEPFDIEPDIDPDMEPLVMAALFFLGLAFI